MLVVEKSFGEVMQVQDVFFFCGEGCSVLGNITLKSLI